MNWLQRIASLSLAGLLALAPISFVFAAGDGNALDQDVRRDLYEQVQKYPGLHLSQLARESDLTTNHAKYHLRVLEDKDLVTSIRTDGYWRFFPKDDNGAPLPQERVDRADKEVLSLLRKPVPLQITMYLLSETEANNKEIADAVDVSPSTAHYHLNTMKDAGMLEDRRDGRSLYYQLSEPKRVYALVQQHEPPDALVDGFLEAWEPLEL